jgi:hypothetical protein
VARGVGRSPSSKSVPGKSGPANRCPANRARQIEAQQIEAQQIEAQQIEAQQIEAMSTSNRKPKYTVRVDNVYFLTRIGLSLRWATQGVAREALPADIRRLLAGLDEVEAQQAAAHEVGEPDNAGA